MKKILSKMIWMFGLGIFIVVILFMVFFKNSSVKDIGIVESLEKDVLPFVQEKKISFYFNMDWCKAIKYESRSAVELLNQNSSNSCLANAPAFSDDDQSVFNEIHSRFDLISKVRFREVDIEYLINDSYERKPIGISFHTDCSFCRTRYVYWSQYSQLPPNIEGEIKYQPINENWYRIDEDWN